MHEIKREMEPDYEKPEVQFPERLVVHPSTHLRIPVVERSEECKNDSANDDVMKMRNHKIGTAELPVERRRPQHDSRQARDQKLEQEANTEEHGNPERNFPAPHRPQPIEYLDPRWNSDSYCRENEETVPVSAHPHREHMVSPDAKADKPDGDCRRHHDGIAEDRFAREHWHNFGDESEGRNYQDVNFRVAENPEEVHPKNCGTSCLGIKKVSAKIAIDKEHDLCRGERRYAKDNHPAHHEIEPCQQGHFSESHAGAAHAEDCCNEVDPCSDTADTRSQQGKSPEIGAVPRRECARSKWRIGPPSNVGGSPRAVKPIAADETEVKEQSSKSSHPKTEGVQSWKGHVPGAYHQRNQIGAEAKEDGHDHEKDHRGAMHRHHAVENFGRNEGIVRNDQLNPHDGGFDTTDDQEEEPVEDVENSQLLVVNSDNPVVQAFADWPGVGADCAEGDGF